MPQTNKYTSDQFFYHSHTANTERCILIGGWVIVRREIETQIKIAWIQIIFGNALVQPTIVCDSPWPERGIFGIVIVDIISRSALVWLCLLCASDLFDRKGPVCFVFLFNMATVSYQYFLNNFIARYTC